PAAWSSGGVLAIVPAAFYRENPRSGADGRLLREEALRLGCPVEVVPVGSAGGVGENAEILAAWLSRHHRGGGRPGVLGRRGSRPRPSSSTSITCWTWRPGGCWRPPACAWSFTAWRRGPGRRRMPHQLEAQEPVRRCRRKVDHAYAYRAHLSQGAALPAS